MLSSYQSLIVFPHAPNPFQPYTIVVYLLMQSIKDGITRISDAFWRVPKVYPCSAAVVDVITVVVESGVVGAPVAAVSDTSQFTFHIPVGNRQGHA